MPKKTKPSQSAIGKAANEANIDQLAQRRTSAGKKPARKKASTAPKTRASKSSRAQPAIDPSDDQVRTRAYFIAQRRHRLAMPGDASSDWLEAKRQLLSELGRR